MNGSDIEAAIRAWGADQLAKHIEAEIESIGKKIHAADVSSNMNQEIAEWDALRDAIVDPDTVRVLEDCGGRDGDYTRSLNIRGEDVNGGDHYAQVVIECGECDGHPAFTMLDLVREIAAVGESRVESRGRRPRVKPADDRVPEDLVACVRRAAEAGAVFIHALRVRAADGDEGVHPVEWELRVDMPADAVGRAGGSSTVAAHQAGEAPTIFIDGRREHLRTDQLHQWIRVTGVSRFFTDVQARGMRVDADLMAAAFRQGWDVIRQRELHGHREVVSLEFTSADRAGGDSACRTWTLRRRHNMDAYFDASITESTGTTTATVEEALRAVHEQAPWPLPVADVTLAVDMFDDECDR